MKKSTIKKKPTIEKETKDIIADALGYNKDSEESQLDNGYKDGLSKDFMIGDFVKTTESFYIQQGADYIFPKGECAVIVGIKNENGYKMYACRFRDDIGWGRTLDGMLRERCGKYVHDYDIELDN
jgi:hypothetical protein